MNAGNRAVVPSLSASGEEALPFLDLPPALRARAEVRLPGSKSISNRVLLLAALAHGTTRLYDLLEADDTARMREALAALGVSLRPQPDGALEVVGCAGAFPVQSADLFLGNAGTAFRPLTAALAVMGGNYQLRGVARMHERPIGDLVEALRSWGAVIDYLGEPGYPPLAISPRPPLAGAAHTRVRGAVSSQFLTALLIAAPLLGTEAVIEVEGELISKPYVSMTLALMAHFGVTVHQEGWHRFTVPAGSSYRTPGVWYVEGDASSASYFLALGALGGGPVRVIGVGESSVQGDVAFADVLAQMGAEVRKGPNWIEAAAPAGLDPSQPVVGKLRALTFDATAIPDAAMTLAALALFADGTTHLTGIGSWRVKETDRIAAMAAELTKVGATVQSGPDWLTITPPCRWQAATIATYDDHRMAMALSLAAFGDIYVRILDPACVNKTFPTYWREYARVVTPVPVVAIDGPSASGKGTVAARVAAALGWHYLDSGAIYRALAWAALDHGVPLDDPAALVALLTATPIAFGDGSVVVGGREVGQAIRSEAVSAAASRIALYPEVRAALIAHQRAWRRRPGLVADGRDMGTVLFPDALVKVFLTASPEVRAERRYKQLIEQGYHANIDQLRREIAARDEQDRSRAAAPLQQAPDARLLDTSDLSIDEAVAKVLKWVHAAWVDPAAGVD